MATELRDVMRGLLRQASVAGDSSATLAGGLVVRVSRSGRGYRITAERVKVQPAEHELHTLEVALAELGWRVHQRGNEEAGLLQRKWFEVGD
ncbi:MAG: hypothetical protein M0Z43_00285 [Acidithiobacillus sp.]|nr:hypothetical protein [Acidithiobacillus sp.]